MGFRLVIGFTDHLHSIATNKDYAVTVLHTLESSQFPLSSPVFW
jgi:hypothetical protein